MLNIECSWRLKDDDRATELRLDERGFISDDEFSLEAKFPQHSIGPERARALAVSKQVAMLSACSMGGANHLSSAASAPASCDGPAAPPPIVGNYGALRAWRPRTTWQASNRPPRGLDSRPSRVTHLRLLPASKWMASKPAARAEYPSTLHTRAHAHTQCSRKPAATSKQVNRLVVAQQINAAFE